MVVEISSTQSLAQPWSEARSKDGEFSAGVRNARLAATRAHDLRADQAATVAGATGSTAAWAGADGMITCMKFVD
jgi:hypothetical protein